MSADWSVVDMLEKTDLLFLSRNQLQIVSWLEAGLCVCFRFSAEILFGLNLLGPVQTVTVSLEVHVH